MQLFTHLLSSYLQGMGDFFSALFGEGRGGAFGRVVEGLLCLGNSVGVAVSRRRYPRQDNRLNWVGRNHKIEYNAYG